MYIYDEKKTVLLTNIWLRNYAGSEVNCLSLAKALKAKGYDVEVATLEADEPMLSEFMKENILVKNLLEEDLVRKHYDIIWAHHAVVVNYVIFTKRVTADKIILSSLSPFEPYEALPCYANEVSLCLANSWETREKLIAEGIDSSKICVFPNYVSIGWLGSIKARTYGDTPQKVAIVSNHVPEELLQTRDILRERGCEVDIYGLGYKTTLITPETLEPYDLIITIGKTVQYAMALRIPVYCYDIHGGPGYLASEDMNRAAFYNFSGRGFPKKSAQIIVDDIFKNYNSNLEMIAELLDFIRETSVLENNIEDVLSAVDQAEKVDVSSIQQKYAHMERNNHALIRLFREKKRVEQSVRKLEIQSNQNAAQIQNLTERCEIIVRQRDDLSGQNEELSQQHEELSQQHEELSQQHEELSQQHEQLSQQHEQLSQQHEQLSQQYEALSRQHQDAQKSLQTAELMSRNLRSSYNQLKGTYNDTIYSRGWRFLSRYYELRDRLFPKDSAIRKLMKVIGRLLLGRRQNAGDVAEMPAVQADSNTVVVQDNSAAVVVDGFELIRTCKRIDILSVPHTEYLAKMLQNVLLEAGLECQTHLREPEQYENIPYIMICPQNFKRFPAVYIAMQMEQTINPRWLTEEYMNILHNAYAVFDYSLENIKYFNQDPMLASKMYYMPVDVCKNIMQQNYSASEKSYDVLFYGAPFVEHRQNFLKPIGERFNLRVVSEQFGPDLYREMNKAKIIINIHYYENALLETTRLYETLSVSDCLIISEKSGDPQEETRLEGLVDFVEVGDVEAMMERIQYWLTHEEERKAKVASNRAKLKSSVSAVTFYLNRFLLANDRITFDEFYNAATNYIHFDTDRVCLSLPESTIRAEDFRKDNKYGFEFFPGLKHRIGWIGCGMSYKFMLRKAMEQQMERILICEDDVYFPPDFEERFGKVLDYVEKNDDWTVFSGIMADLGRVKPLKYVEENEEEFIYLDKMISMVFNLYDKSVFEAISNWDNTNRNVEKNTIDRYLENRKMRILTTCPFLVGHKEDLTSTIWGQQNTIYTELIQNSSVKLREIVDKFKKTL